MRGLLQTEFPDALGALPAEILVQLHSNGASVKLLRGGDDDAAVTAAQIEHLFAWFKISKLQHFHHDGLRRRIIGREFQRLLRRRYDANQSP